MLDMSTHIMNLGSHDPELFDSVRGAETASLMWFPAYHVVLMDVFPYIKKCSIVLQGLKKSPPLYLQNLLSRQFL